MSGMKTINVTLSDATLNALREMGYTLYWERASQTTSAEGVPLVWMAMPTYLDFNAVPLFSTYAAFVTNEVASNGVVIQTSVAAAADLGDVVTLESDMTLTVAGGGFAGALTIRNTTTKPFTAGLTATDVGFQPQPIAAVPLYGLAEDVIAPLDTFLATFSTAGVPVGSPLQYSMSQSLIIDMSGAVYANAQFDINNGWSFNGAPGKTVPAGTDLFPLLASQALLAEET